MRIAFDAQLLFEKQKTGIGWNTKMLIDEMIKDERNEYQLNCFNFGKNKRISKIIDEYKDKGCIVKECHWISAPVYNHLERILPFPYKWLFGTQADTTQFFNYTVPFNVGTKCVTFIYDMAYKAYPETVAKRARRWLDTRLKDYCERADIIVTVSEFSKKEILKYLPAYHEKVRVVYSGVDTKEYHTQHKEEEISQVKKKYSITGEYILYLGTLEPRKNIEHLLDAYMELRRENKNFPKLILAGKKGWLYDSIFKTVKEYDLQEDVIFTGYVDESDIPCLMQGAMMFVFPSLYEGFGIPPLEAMACGTPVITSDSSSLPEVVGDAALKINPANIEEIKRDIYTLYSDDRLQKDLNLRGIKQAAKFSWKTSSIKLLNIYEEMKMENLNANA